MAYQPLVRVYFGDSLRPEHLNQFVDAIESVQGEQQAQPPSAAGLLSLGLIACGSTTKRVTRRSLIGLRWKK